MELGRSDHQPPPLSHPASMHFSKLAIASSLLALTSTVQCKVILIGDSTSARTGANDGYTAGWGATAQKCTCSKVDRRFKEGRVPISS